MMKTENLDPGVSWKECPIGWKAEEEADTGHQRESMEVDGIMVIPQRAAGEHRLMLLLLPLIQDLLRRRKGRFGGSGKQKIHPMNPVLQGLKRGLVMPLSCTRSTTRWCIQIVFGLRVLNGPL
jgi:hypothetical protein